jgi:hypothetical protein
MLWHEIRSSLVRTGYDNEAALPVTLDFVKEHARIATDITDFDAILTAYIFAAEQLIEDAGKLLRDQTWRLTFQCLPHVMSDRKNLFPIHLYPSGVVTSLKYRQVDRTQITLTVDDDYTVYDSFDPVLVGVDCDSTAIVNVSDEIDAWEAIIDVTAPPVPPQAQAAIAVACAYWFRNPETFAVKQFDKSTNLAFDGLVNSLSRRLYS